MILLIMLHGIAFAFGCLIGSWLYHKKMNELYGVN